MTRPPPALFAGVLSCCAIVAGALALWEEATDYGYRHAMRDCPPVQQGETLISSAQHLDSGTVTCTYTTAGTGRATHKRKAS